MNIALVYIVVTHGPISADYCARFVASYQLFPPGMAHKTIVCCNGGRLNTSLRLVFSALTPEFYERDNDPGWDLSGYMDVAEGPAKDADAMLCVGESVYFHRNGWMLRLANAWGKHGPGLYGPFASHNVRAHLNTTAFMCSPKDILTWPQRRWASRKDRYEFEHGQTALWRRMQKRGLPVYLVTWDGEWPPGQWRRPNNILWRGDQSNLLFCCNHSEGWEKQDMMTKRRWSAKADQPFQ